MKLFIIATMLALLVLGCQTPARMSTHSGSPEIEITGWTTDQIRARMVNEMINHGFELRNSDNYRLVFDKKDNSLTRSIFLGSHYDTEVWDELRVTIIDTGSGALRLCGEGFLIGNRGSAFQHETRARGMDQDIQKMLVRFRDSQ